MSENELKKCRTCNLEFPQDNFRKTKNRKKETAYHTQCKNCDKIDYQNNKEKIKARSNKYRLENRDKINAQKMESYYANHEENKEKNNKYSAEHREEIKERKAIFRENNRERLRQEGRDRYAANPEKYIQKAREYYKSNREDVLKRQREYNKKRRAKISDAKAIYYRNNNESIKLKRKLHKPKANARKRERWQTDIKYRLMLSIRNRINISVKTNSPIGSDLEGLLGYKIDDLIMHLKTTLPEGVTWEDYVSRKIAIHIDHIKPLCKFTIKNIHDPELKKAWALENLQLLHKIDNLKKSSKYEEVQEQNPELN